MSKRLILFDLVLLVACIYIGRSVYRDFLLFRTNHNAHTTRAPEDTGQNDPALTAALLPLKAAVPVDNAAFTHISQKNLFLQSRNLTEDAAEVVEVVPQLNPKPILIGVIKIGSESKAMLLNPATAPGQKGSSTVRMGDVVQGYKVSQITSEQVQLTYTSPTGAVTSQSLDLKDLKGRPQRPLVKTPLAESQVVNVAPRPAPAVAINPAEVPQAPLRANEYIDSQGRRVARTPFGDKVLSAPGGSPAGGPSTNPMGGPMSRRGQVNAGRPYP